MQSNHPIYMQGSPTRREALRVAGLGAALLGFSDASVFAAASNAVLTESSVLSDPDIPVIGNADGDVTIVEYFDYQCYYCRKLEPELRQAVQDDGKVRLILRDWPVLGGPSIFAARLVLATKYQNKFQEAHDALIGLNSRLTEPGARELLTSAGVDVDRASRDLETNQKTVDAILARNDAQAKALGFRGTPAFIIGKFRVPGVPTLAQFEQVIADVRKAATKK